MPTARPKIYEKIQHLGYSRSVHIDGCCAAFVALRMLTEAKVTSHMEGGKKEQARLFFTARGEQHEAGYGDTVYIENGEPYVEKTAKYRADRRVVTAN